jgi:CRP-like cAMP-binding protein
MATVGEVKLAAQGLYGKGEALHALRCYDAVVAEQPLDLDARMKVADCLVALGQRDAAVAIYRQAAWFGLKSGHPLPAVVCAYLIHGVTGQPADDILTALTATYGHGSDMVGKLAARLAPPAPDTPMANPPDLRAPPPPELVTTAAQRAEQATRDFDEFPEALHPVPLLSELTDQGFRRVLSSLLVRRLPDASMVIREGEPGESFFFVAGGLVRVVSTDSLGRQTELARLGEGALFGEMALLGSQPRTASVQVVGEADLLEVTRVALAAIAGELAPVAAALDRFTRERLLKNLVATSPLFRPFSRVQQLDLLRRFTSHDAAPGTIIIREGDAGRGLFVVLTGEVEVHKRDELGVDVPIATLRAGELFGEIALLRGGQATATVSAARQTTVLFLAREYFERLVEAVPELRTYFETLSDDRVAEARQLLGVDSPVPADEQVLI